jgi:predicted neutral ceramidase superfamily lipid hydrolase
MVIQGFVVSVIFAILFHAIIRKPLWASLASGIALVFFVRFLFGYHFPGVNSVDFWLFSAFIVAIGAGIAFLVGRMAGKDKENPKS